MDNLINYENNDLIVELKDSGETLELYVHDNRVHVIYKYNIGRQEKSLTFRDLLERLFYQK